MVADSRQMRHFLVIVTRDELSGDLEVLEKLIDERVRAAIDGGGYATHGEIPEVRECNRNQDPTGKNRCLLVLSLEQEFCLPANPDRYAVLHTLAMNEASVQRAKIGVLPG